MSKRQCALVVFCMMGMTMWAQVGWLVKAVKSVGAFLDSATVKGVDPRYITAPKQPWQLIARYNMDRMDVTMHSNYDLDESIPGMDFELISNLRTNTSNRVGLWLGYRGYGIGYSTEVGKGNGTFFTVSATGGCYGVNLRMRTFETKELDMTMKIGGEISVDGEKGVLPDPIRIRSLMIDGFYFFNKKHFSYMAAYDQSAIQIRSAGSLMVGAMWHHSTIRYESNRNAAYISLMREVGTIKVRQGSFGVGYAYNWVPFKGFLANATVMPMLTVYNCQKSELYDAFMDEEVDITDNDQIFYRESLYHHSPVSLTYYARVSLTYNWNRFFINAYGQWNRFNYDNGEEGHGRIKDWFVNTSVGIRF